MPIKSLLKKFLASQGKELAPLGTRQAWDEASLVTRALATLIGQSQGQLRQDLFVLCELGFKRGGYFVEFGVADGVLLSNTLLLEREFGWTGIVAEPARRWHQALNNNRRCHIETACVWRDSMSTLEFTEADLAELSTITSYTDGDFHASARKTGHTYAVNTISLNDLLAKYDAPKQIDYLSIDTEGSEFDILECFDFSSHEFQVITCEHNYTPAREELFQLLSSHGYERKYAGLTKFDDWFVKK